MRRIKIRSKSAAFVAAVMLAFAAALLSGCGASLTVYDYTENGERYNKFVLSLDADVVRAMEDSAIYDGDGKRYTVQSYFYSLFTGFGCELTDARYDGDGYTVAYRKAYDGATDLEEIGTKVAFERTIKRDPFIKTVEETSPNPFNGVRQAYDEVLPEQSSTLIQQLKNGRVAVDEFGETVVQFPSVTDAFPYLRRLNADGLLLNYVMRASKRTKTSGERISTSGRNGEFMFSHYFDRTVTDMRLKYKRPVPYGWYLVALAAGGATVAIIVLCTRKKKPKKPTLLERFPYNPEEYRDYETHLPTKL